MGSRVILTLPCDWVVDRLPFASGKGLGASLGLFSWATPASGQGLVRDGRVISDEEPDAAIARTGDESSSQKSWSCACSGTTVRSSFSRSKRSRARKIAKEGSVAE